MKLFLCSGCNRHIKDDADACPFCGGRRGALVGDSAVRAPRVGRAALVAVAAAGTVAVSLALTSCSESAAYGCTPNPDCTSGDAGTDGGG